MSNFISLEKAIQMTANYKNQKVRVMDGDFRTQQNVLPLSETFGREAFDTVLAQEGCVGLRLYFGMDENNLIRAIIVGVDAQNQDILPKPVSKAKAAYTAEGEEEGGSIIENGLRCPNICPPSSPLNP